MDYLKENSGLPGKRGDLDLLGIIAERGDEDLFLECLTYSEERAPTNTPGEFIATCGVTGLGRLITEGKEGYFHLLKKYASDCRWRVREGVAFALQIVGKWDFDTLSQKMQEWKNGNPFEKRAVVAGLCEPVLLKKKGNALRVLEMLEQIFLSIEAITDRKDESFRVLKKGLGYGFSVAIVACPQKGKELFEKLVHIPDQDIQWILRENLKKKRVEKMDSIWLDKMKRATT